MWFVKVFPNIFGVFGWVLAGGERIAVRKIPQNSAKFPQNRHFGQFSLYFSLSQGFFLRKMPKNQWTLKNHQKFFSSKFFKKDIFMISKFCWFQKYGFCCEMDHLPPFSDFAQVCHFLLQGSGGQFFEVKILNFFFLCQNPKPRIYSWSACFLQHKYAIFVENWPTYHPLSWTKPSDLTAKFPQNIAKFRKISAKFRKIQNPIWPQFPPPLSWA